MLLFIVNLVIECAIVLSHLLVVSVGIGKHRLARCSNEFLYLRTYVWRCLDDGIAIVERNFVEVEIRKVIVIVGKNFGWNILEDYHVLEVVAESVLHVIVIDREDDFRLAERRFVAERFLYIDWRKGTHPSMAVYNLGTPAQFLYCFENATGIEHSTLTVVFVLFPSSSKPIRRFVK